MCWCMGMNTVCGTYGFPEFLASKKRETAPPSRTAQKRHRLCFTRSKTRIQPNPRFIRSPGSTASMQAPGDPVVQTLARFGEHASCEGLTVDRAGNIYAAVRESEGKPLHMLQLKQGSNELVQLPVRLDKHVYSIAISPSGQELYVGQMMAGFWST